MSKVLINAMRRDMRLIAFKCSVIDVPADVINTPDCTKSSQPISCGMTSESPTKHFRLETTSASR